jgi:diguanylate cyclase (GGDEF)-like protein
VSLGGVVDDVTTALRDAATVDDACRRAVDAVGRHTGAMIAALLHVHDHLRCVAAAGAWSVFSSVPTDAGVVGRVYRTGQTVTLSDATQDGDYVSLAAVASTEICAPLLGCDGRPIGALNLEWTKPAQPEPGSGGGDHGLGNTGRAQPEPGSGGGEHGLGSTALDLQGWRAAVVEIARRLSQRIVELGGPPAEAAGEQLLRHALLMTSAGNEQELLRRSLTAARAVSGLATPLLVLTNQLGTRACLDPAAPTELGGRLAALAPVVLTRIALRARRHGASYTLGDPSELDTQGFEALTAVGVRSMITVPVGPAGEPDSGVLFVVDDAVSRPTAATVNLLELLAAQAWTSLDRLRTLWRLRERAICDPLTGLRHVGPFDERLAAAEPGRTALLAIDVDRFKHINDTYGHQAGDRALVDLAATLQNALRAQDELYRIGGDEFAAVVEVQRLEEATGVAQRLLTAARRIGYPISVGVALQVKGETPKQALRRADMALYEVKQTGRDGVRVAAARPAADVA